MSTFSYKGYPAHLKLLIAILSICLSMELHAQYAPAAGQAGSTAIPASADSIRIWATGCTVIRGAQDIAVPSSGLASAGDSSQAIGPAGGNTIVSLGDGGTAILTFDHAISDAPGFDFVVFENGFNAGGAEMAFLELAFVEVSSDGQRYIRFPAADDTQDTVQIPNGGTMNASRLNNLAGKYISGYGTPFELDELRDSTGLDIHHITHVRIVDVVGSIADSVARHDSRGHKINDPYPTPFASCGFDLDAVGVMHADGTMGVSNPEAGSIQIYPNPVTSTLYVKGITNETARLSLLDALGARVMGVDFSRSAALDMTMLPAGVYLATVATDSNTSSRLIVKQ